MLRMPWEPSIPTSETDLDHRNILIIPKRNEWRIYLLAVVLSPLPLAGHGGTIFRNHKPKPRLSLSFVAKNHFLEEKKVVNNQEIISAMCRRVIGINMMITVR